MGEDLPPNDVEFLDVGPKRRRPGGLGPSRRLGWASLLAGTAAAAVIAGIVHAAVTPSGPPAAHPTSTTALAPPLTFGPISTMAAPPPVVTELGHPLLGARPGWEIFGRGVGVVVRIELARGRITRTAVPSLASSGPVSFVGGSGWALVRPIDFVPGCLITDGQPARPAPGALNAGGQAFPGTDAQHLWIPARGSSPKRMVLVGIDGQPTGTSIAVPAGSSPFDAIPDQRGNLLFGTPDGVYEVEPGAPQRRVTSRTVVAVGPTRLLTGTCDKRGSCRLVVINPATDREHPLNGRLDQAGRPTGVVSPDGTSAAVFRGLSTKRIAIINLTTGATRTLPLRIDPVALNLGSNTMAWSPDSRWLFVVAANGHLEAVDAHTAHLTDLTSRTGHRLPNLVQLAVPLSPAS